MLTNKFYKVAVMALLTSVSGWVFAHGNTTPQAVDTTGLPQMSELPEEADGDWDEDTNPFRDPGSEYHDLALKIGSSAYNQNCARCHGLEAISGGIAPDLRMLAEDYDGDEWFRYRVSGGAVRNGAVYMPSFKGIFTQEAAWAIRTYIDSRPVEE